MIANTVKPIKQTVKNPGGFVSLKYMSVSLYIYQCSAVSSGYRADRYTTLTNLLNVSMGQIRRFAVDWFLGTRT